MHFHLCIIKDIKHKETNKARTQLTSVIKSRFIGNTTSTAHVSHQIHSVRSSPMQFSVAHHNQSLNRINIWASEVLKDYGVEEQARRRSHPGRHFVVSVRVSKLWKLRRQDRHCEYIAYCYGICYWTSHRYDFPSMILRHLSIAFSPYHSLPSNDN